MLLQEELLSLEQLEEEGSLLPQQIQRKVEIQSQLLMILFPCLAQCLSMGAAALHFITSNEKDGNSSSTLSFSNACTYMPSTIDATFVYLSL